MKYPKESKLCCSNCKGKGYILVKSEDFLSRRPIMKSVRMRNKIRQLAKDNDLKELSLREIGKLVGIKHAETVKYHLSKIEQIGWNMEKIK